MRFDEAKFRLKGWSEEEIAVTKSLLDSIKRKRHHRDKRLSEVLFWFLLLLSVLAVLVLSWFVVPLLLFLNLFVSLVVVAFLAFVFGSLFSFIILELEHLGLRHHLLFSFFIPVVSVIVFFFLLSRIGLRADSLLFALVFVVAFLSPYFFKLFK